jgi:PA14 domain
VSVIWSGFLRAPTTDSYIFSIYANDGVRLTVNQVEILSNMTIVEDELSGHRLVSLPVSLVKNKFVPIQVEYFENKEQAFIKLMWRLASKTSASDQVIPSTNFFYERSPVPISGLSSLVTGQFTPRRPTNVY